MLPPLSSCSFSFILRFLLLVLILFCLIFLLIHPFRFFLLFSLFFLLPSSFSSSCYSFLLSSSFSPLRSPLITFYSPFICSSLLLTLCLCMYVSRHSIQSLLSIVSLKILLLLFLRFLVLFYSCHFSTSSSIHPYSSTYAFPPLITSLYITSSFSYSSTSSTSYS